MISRVPSSSRASGGVWLYVAATHDAARLRLLHREGVWREAQVVRLGRTRGEHPGRVVTYRYDAGGHLRLGRATLRPRDRRRIEAGSAN